MIDIIKRIINFFLQLRINSETGSKLKIIKKNVVLARKDSKLESNYINRWKKLGKTPSTLFMNLMRSINGIDSDTYVP